MADRSGVADFVETYRRAFQAFDTATIGDLFAYPCAVAGGDDRVTVASFASRETWVPTIERILAGYRAIGVRRVELGGLRVDELTPRLALALVRWRLADGEGRVRYDFQAAYTLVDRGDGWRITAIAHNEPPHPRATAERHAGEQR